MQKLILGTAALGKPYGIKGDPVPDEKELERIARSAWDGGIRVIHTSWQYGLPKIASAIFSEFEWIEKSKIDTQIFDLNYKHGLSVYSSLDLKIYDLKKMDILQVPINILDKRFVDKKLHAFHEIHARSVFLQGLLLMENIPNWVSLEARQQIKWFHDTCEAERLEPYDAALGYVLGLDEVDRVIVGVNSAKQLEQLLTVKPLKWDYDFSITDENVLNPNRWPR